MKLETRFSRALVASLAGATLLAATGWADIPTVKDPSPSVASFQLEARPGYIKTPDGNTIFIWGYGNINDPSYPVQYPGPTLEVNEGDLVQIELTNALDVPVSIVLPGQTGVVTTSFDGVTPNPDGLLTKEVAKGGRVNYSFIASHPGSYMYHSGTNPDLQVEMGLFGALIVRPKNFDPAVPARKRAYDHWTTRYDREYLFLLSEMDPRVHRLVENGKIAQVDPTNWFPVYWFVNGRAAPDTFQARAVAFLPTQPYNALVAMHPGEKVLMRVMTAGRDPHPLHNHGSDAIIIARDGRLLTTNLAKSSGLAGPGANLAFSTFTHQAYPGRTQDGIFEWTGNQLGWNIYGPDPLNQPAGGTTQDPLSAGTDVPVLLPENLDLMFGGFWSGSPYLGNMGALPPGEGGLNPNGAFTYLWHSHTEKELVNNNIFPGGMISILFVEHPRVALPPE